MKKLLMYQGSTADRIILYLGVQWSPICDYWWYILHSLSLSVMTWLFYSVWYGVQPDVVQYLLQYSLFSDTWYHRWPSLRYNKSYYYILYITDDLLLTVLRRRLFCLFDTYITGPIPLTGMKSSVCLTICDVVIIIATSVWLPAIDVIFYSIDTGWSVLILNDVSPVAIFS